MQADQTARRTLDLVEEWAPKKAYGHEREFQSELQTFLDERLNESGGFGPQQSHAVSTERGRSNGDVVVDDSVGIELKRDLSNSQVDRLTGQIEKYRDEYDSVIICACGIDDMDGWRRLQQNYENAGFGMMNPTQAPVSFVHKKKEDYGTGRSQSESVMGSSTNPVEGGVGGFASDFDNELDDLLGDPEDTPEIIQVMIVLAMVAVLLYTAYLLVF